MRRALGLLVVVLLGCRGGAVHEPIAAAGGTWILRGASLDGAVVDLGIDGDAIAWIAPSGTRTLPAGARVVDARGGFVSPGVIDSHVHLVYAPVGEALARSGVVAAVDLAAPIDALAHPPRGPRLIMAGPMLTAPDGYPLDSWGRDGYGLAVSTPAEAEAAVDRLADAGARVIKVAVTDPPTLDDATLAAAVARAHARGLKVAAHALGDSDARRAAAAGCDLLAHAPVEPLADATVAAWRGRAVISTLRAFGASADAVENLRRLAAAGVTVLYGTDLGNSPVVGVDGDELALLASILGDPAAALASATSLPARYWGWDDLGAVRAGARASFLVTDVDPRRDPSALTRPTLVVLDGRAITAAR